MADKINNGQYSELAKLDLSSNTRELQKPDDTPSVVKNIIRRLMQTPEERRPRAMEEFSISYANSNQELRRIVENPSKVKFMMRLFQNPHFESTVGDICTKWFDQMYLVTWSVSDPIASLDNREITVNTAIPSC
jgi:hypothetical protein